MITHFELNLNVIDSSIIICFQQEGICMTYHEDLYMIYRDRLRALREDSDLSQKTIADYLGIGQTTYSQYELGKRSMPVEYIIRLCQFYNVSADYMLGLSNEK